MKSRDKTPLVGLCLAVLSMVFAVSLYAQEEMAMEAEANVQPDAPVVEEGPSDPLPLGAVTPWYRYGEDYSEGLVDVLYPLYYNDGLFLFTNLRGAYSDVSEQELNIGFGLRQQLDACDTILGLNAYYDSRWTEENNQFNQIGFGVEMLSTWLDARANAYIPEDEKELLGTEEETALTRSSTSTTVSAFAEGNTIVEQTLRETTSTFTTSTFSIYEVPLEGYDVEIGVKLPLSTENVEARIFGGYYSFSPVWEGNVASDNDIEGFKGRAELRIHDRFLLDAEVFEDDRLFGSDYLVSARVSLPFDVSAIARGENPFKAAPEERAGFSSRLSEMVMRDPHIQIRSETSVSTTTFDETTISRRKELALTDVIFVDADNVADPLENGSAENPFDLVQEGVDASEERSQPNVVVLSSAAPYTENVSVENDINLMGTGAGFGTSGVMLDGGVAPIVAGGGDDDFIIHFEEAGTVLVRGFTFDGIPFGGGSAPLGALNFTDVMDVTVTQNTFQNLGTGVTTMVSDSLTEEFQFVVTENSFSRNGVGVAGMFQRSGDFHVLNNQIEDTLLGVLAVGIDTSSRPRTLIQDNAISYDMPLTTTDIAALDGLLGGLFGGLPPDLPFPMVSGIAVGGVNGGLDAEVHDNTISGPLLGITGFTAALGDNAGMNFNATGNWVSGGGLDETLDLILDSGALDFLLGPISSDDFSLDYDAGLLGISLISLGLSDPARINDAVIEGNYVENTLLGINTIAFGEGRVRRALIENNMLVDNGLGITGLALSGGNLSDTVIQSNIVDGGGLPKLLGALDPMLGAITPDASFAGITLLGFGGGDLDDIQIIGNQVSDHILGVSVLGISGTDMRRIVVADNIVEDNFSGVLLAGIGGVRMQDSVVENNTISGAGTAFIGDLLGLLLSEDLDVPDVGLAGVTILGALETDADDITVAGNTISDEILGVVAIAIDEVDMRRLQLNDNTISNTFGGVLVLGIGPDARMGDASIAGNTIEGAGTAFIGDILGLPDDIVLPDVGLAGVTVVGAAGADLDDLVIEDNEVSDQIIGVLALGAGSANMRRMEINNNTLQDNLAGVLVVGFGSDANLNDLEVNNNTIDGAGGTFVGDVIGELLSEDLDIPDVGLAGITLLSIGEASINNFEIDNNVITEQMIGVMAVGLYDGDARNGVIEDNEISHGAFGIIAAGVDGGNVNNVVIEDNEVIGFGVDLTSPVSLGGFDLFTDKAAVGITVYANDGRARNAIVEDNDVENNEVGILEMEVDSGSTNGFSSTGNSFTDNTVDEVSIP